MKTVLVTGDSKGLGFKICETLSKNININVIGISRSRKIKGNWKHYSLDITNEKDIKAIIELSKKADVLIHNAGISSNNLFIVESKEKIEKVFKLNLMSPIQITKGWMKKRLLQKKKGQVIFISSICTKKTFKGLSAYAASKSALNSYAKSIAFEMGKKGITSNIILPGYMKTEMTSEMKESDLEKIKNKTPLKEFCKTSDVTSIIEYMVLKNKFLNGSEITIDGGFTL